MKIVSRGCQKGHFGEVLQILSRGFREEGTASDLECRIIDCAPIVQWERMR